jgi:uncharacterized protein
MSTAENKDVVLSFFDNLSAGKLDAALALMDDNVTWWVAGKPEQFALAGTYDKAQFAAMVGAIGAAMPTGVQVSITGVTAEDDRVAVEAEERGRSAAGKAYHNQFHYLFEVRDGRIHAVREYLDTMHADEVLVDY